MDTITITPFKEGMDMEKTKRELDIHADGYRKGYKAAIDRACEWLSKQGFDWWEGYGIPFTIEDFKKAMESEG